MSTRTSYEPGVPCWADLGAPDLADAVDFYTSLFGWEAEDQGEQYMHYHQFRKDGRAVAGLGPLVEGAPPAWLTYVSTDDVDATAEKVRSAGGQVLMGPMDVPDVCRMAIFADDEGAAFAGFQAAGHVGAELVNEPGAMSWNEAARRDLDGARSFYGEVFGWGTESVDMPGGPYTSWKVGDRAVAGMMGIREEWGPDVPPHWMTYFAVEDPDAVAARAKELGGRVMAEPFDTPAGRMAVLGDRAGAAFSVIALNPETTDG